MYVPKKKDSINYIRKYRFLYSNYDIKRNFPKYFIIYDLIRVFLVTFIIALLPKYPIIQSAFNLFFIFSYFLLFIIVRPYISLIFNICQFIIEICLLLAFGCAFLIAILDSKSNIKNDNTEKKIYVGKIMVFSVMGMISFTILLMIIPLFILLIKLLFKKKENKVNL